MKQKVLITAALLYANGLPHFGHIAGAYLPADCYARFKRFSGHDVLFLSGSDEYGAAITLSAEQEGRSPRAHVDHYYQESSKIFKSMGIDFDRYSRTTLHCHTETTQAFYEDLKKNGYIKKQITEQLYSEKDDKFLADRYVMGICPSCHYEKARGDECPKCGASFEATELKKPVSKLTGAPLVLKETEHSFFLLDKLKSELKEWIKTKDWKPQVLNMALQYIEDAKPRSITRDLKWGIPVPHVKDKVFYVWFDAPIGYISAAKDWSLHVRGDKDAWKEYFCDENTKYVQFIGKDNIPFHAVFFPAMIMGQNQPYKLVDELPANSFFHYEGKKFSKSEGWTIDLKDFFKRYQSDQIRYTLAANAPENADSEFCWKDFQNKNNADLVGKFGNFINRVLVFIQSRAEGVIPELKDATEDDKAFLEDLNRVSEEIQTAYDGFHLRQAAQKLMELASVCNVYFDQMEPWKVFKEDKDRMRTILAHCLIGVKALAALSYPIIPNASQKIWELLGFKDELSARTLEKCLNLSFESGKKLPKPEILFTKIEDEEIRAELDKLHEKKPKEKKTKMIDIENFMDVDLRVGEVLEAESVPKSNKLLKLRVDLGDETRTVVSGIKKHYSPEDVVGKRVILVANLKPAKIMGVESHGMILAGSHGDLLELPSLKNLPPGSKVS